MGICSKCQGDTEADGLGSHFGEIPSPMGKRNLKFPSLWMTLSESLFTSCLGVFIQLGMLKFEGLQEQGTCFHVFNVVRNSKKMVNAAE